MDWSKAKTILIFAFIITNILLVSVLVSNEKHTDSTIKKEFINNAIKILEGKDISIETAIPTEIPSLNSLIVEYENMDISLVNNKFFSNKGFINYDGEGIVEMSKDKESISITNEKKLIYENKNSEKLYTQLNENLSEDIVRNFLIERSYDISDMKLSYIKEEQGEYYLMFSKLYKDKYLETAYVNAIVDSRGVRRLERMWLNVKDESENPIYINTAPKAIMNLLSMDETHGKTIIDISLSYYFDPDEQEYIKDASDAKQGKTIPAWRIILDDGYKVIIDNY